MNSNDMTQNNVMTMTRTMRLLLLLAMMTVGATGAWMRNSYIFNELDKINTMRNRIAHHEPVCFYLQDPVIDTTHVLGIYLKMQRLFAWMGIDSHALLYGLDHVHQVCRRINELKQ